MLRYFPLHLMIKTALRAPFFMTKLQKQESNGYVNHTVLKIKGCFQKIQHIEHFIRVTQTGLGAK